MKKHLVKNLCIVAAMGLSLAACDKIDMDSSMPAKKLADVQARPMADTLAKDSVTKKSAAPAVVDTAVVDIASADTAAVESSAADTVAVDTVVSSSSIPSSSSIRSSSSRKVASSSETAPVDSAVTDSVEAEVDTSICADTPNGVLCDTRDGHRYGTVYLAGRVWMARNLNFEAPGSWCFKNKAENCSQYGRLYTWASAMGVDASFNKASLADSIQQKHQGVCPEGWHIPKNADMVALHDFIQQQNASIEGLEEGVGTSLKKATGWEVEDDAPVGTDRYGFAAEPAGYRGIQGNFEYLGEDASFWIADEASEPTHAPYWNLYNMNADFKGGYSAQKSTAYSVRCIKD